MLYNKDFKTVMEQIDNKTEQATELYWDWFCTDKQLVKNAEICYKRSKFIIETLKIDPTQVNIAFKNRCPMEGDLYDSIFIANINDEDKRICISPRLGHRNTPTYKNCEIWINRTNEEIVYENWSKFKSVIKNDELIQEKLRKELGL